MMSKMMRSILRLMNARKIHYLLFLAGIFILIFYFVMDITASRMATQQKEPTLDINNIEQYKAESIPTMDTGHIIWRVPLNVFDLKNVSDDQSKCYPLKIRPLAQICVHSDKDDVYVSKNLRVKGIWEAYSVALFQRALVRDPQLDVIDIGANLGLFSLAAAALKRKVLSVEPLEDNIKHFHKSVKINAFEDRITLVTNAISNKREKVYFKTYKANKGGTSMWEGKKACKNKKMSCPFAMSVYMDDLVPLVKARNITKAIMKIDIEGAEHLAFAEASEFFSSVQITMIFMELAIQREFCGQQGIQSEDKILTNKMFKFLQQQGFTRVYAQGRTLKQMDPKLCSKQWPRDVVWVREKQVYPP